MVPQQRGAARASLTQKGARSGATCEICGDDRLTELTLTLTDGSLVHFTACQHCEARTWRQADRDLSFDAVIEKTRKPR
jgi:hypothetical protein